MRPTREDTVPWYRQFWPWFLISLPATAVIAGIVTINLAIRSDDGLVADDYYKQGLGLHKDAARVRTAQQLGVTATLTHDASQGSVIVQLNDAPVGQLDALKLTLFHPTRRNQDQDVVMKLSGHRRYRVDIAALESANWKVSLEPPSGQWRISGRLSIPKLSTAQLK